jgi:hypothetical protein
MRGIQVAEATEGHSPAGARELLFTFEHNERDAIVKSWRDLTGERTSDAKVRTKASRPTGPVPSRGTPKESAADTRT